MQRSGTCRPWSALDMAINGVLRAWKWIPVWLVLLPVCVTVRGQMVSPLAGAQGLDETNNWG